MHQYEHAYQKGEVHEYYEIFHKNPRNLPGNTKPGPKLAVCHLTRKSKPSLRLQCILADPDTTEQAFHIADSFEVKSEGALFQRNCNPRKYHPQKKGTPSNKAPVYASSRSIREVNLPNVTTKEQTDENAK